jgi:hypothetical protein
MTELPERGNTMKTVATLLCAVCVVCAEGVCAQPVSYGDWYVHKELADIQIANTSSGAAVAGVLCLVSAGTCSAYLGTDTPCAEGVETPMVINSAVGASAVTATCTSIGNQKYNVFSEFGSVRAAFESGGVVGFAMPLRSGEFRVVRFNTRGATAAIRDAMTSPSHSRDSPTKSDVRL